MCKPRDALKDEVRDEMPASSLDGSRAKTRPVTFFRLTEGVPVTSAELDALWKLYLNFVDELPPKID